MLSRRGKGIKARGLDIEIQNILGHLSGKWKLLILWRLSRERYWFNKLRKNLGNISTSSLTNQLIQLEQAGLIERKVYPETPPVVEYYLSPLGKSLRPVFKALEKWVDNLLD